MFKTTDKVIRYLPYVVPIGIPILLVLLLVWLAQSPFFALQPEALSLGITVDVVMTIPLLYFLLIRHRDIPNSTAIPLFATGILIASFILPTQHQFYLTQVKTWLFPVVELAVLVTVALKVRQTVSQYRVRREGTPDTYSALKDATATTLPPLAAKLLTSEIAIIYYGFLNWRKRTLHCNEFSYHRHSGSVALLATVVLLTLTETAIVHLLLARWNIVVAWVLTGISFYTALQVFGILRSLSKRPIVLDSEMVTLRYGILSEATVLRKDIASVVCTTQLAAPKHQVRYLSPLGEVEPHNVLIYLKTEGTLHWMYGFQKSFMVLALYVDEPERFASALSDESDSH